MSKQKKINIACVISGGKDGLFAYYKLKNKNKKFRVKYFLNLFSKKDKVSFHQYPKKIVKLQAEAIGIPILQIAVTEQSENQEKFEKDLVKIIRNLKRNKIDGISFGYVLTTDYQHKLLLRICKEEDVKLILPNFGKKSEKILSEIISSGIKSVVTSVKSEKISSKWLGHDIDNEFFDYLKSLDNTDLCGDYGEYHTFVYDAPFFSRKIQLKDTRKVFKTILKQGGGKLIERHLYIERASLVSKKNV